MVLTEVGIYDTTGKAKVSILALGGDTGIFQLLESPEGDVFYNLVGSPVRAGDVLKALKNYELLPSDQQRLYEDLGKHGVDCRTDRPQ